MLSKVTTLLTIVLLVGCGACKSTQPTPVDNSQPSPIEKDISASAPANQAVPIVPPNESAVVKPKLDACALLTGNEIQMVQGEGVKESKLSGQTTGGFHVSQCFFTLPTFTNSISLMVAHKGQGEGARDPKEFWRSTFHDVSKDPKKEKGGEQKKEESRPAQKISGLGDEAFWMGNQVSGALYVLKGDAYVRLSIGGPANEASKRRTKTLAQKAIARL